MSKHDSGFCCYIRNLLEMRFEVRPVVVNRHNYPASHMYPDWTITCFFDSLYIVDYSGVE